MYLVTLGGCSSFPQADDGNPPTNVTDIGMGILIIYETWRPLLSAQILVADNFIIPYYSISLSLNAILTLMIVIRLALHSKSLRDAMGPLSRPDRL